MTQKELLYVEDAVGHEQNIIKILDESLISFMNKELKKHTTMQEKLMDLLKENANEW